MLMDQRWKYEEVRVIHDHTEDFVFSSQMYGEAIQ